MEQAVLVGQHRFLTPNFGTLLVPGICDTQAVAPLKNESCQKRVGLV